MSTSLKVLTIILSERLNTFAETNNLFSVSQAGFRRSEECVTQAACMIDTLQRRKLKDMSTFVTFIDFKKAYDMVPHGALFAKLKSLGIRGRCLEFLQGLYSSSTVQVRLGIGPQAILSDTCKLLRGLRQGCPLSPVLFNFFINDIFDDREGDYGLSGVVVPYGKKGEISHDFKIKGDMFADDCATFSESIEDLVACCAHVTHWAHVLGDEREI